MTPICGDGPGLWVEQIGVGVWPLRDRCFELLQPAQVVHGKLVACQFPVKEWGIPRPRGFSKLFAIGQALELIELRGPNEPNVLAKESPADRLEQASKAISAR